MKFSWFDLVGAFKSSGYTGDGADFGDVINWLSDEGRSTETVVVKGEEVALADLYAERNGKPFDATEVEAKAAEESRVRDLVKETLGAVAESTGVGRKAVKRPDVSVGKDRLADDRFGGFKSLGHFLVDVKAAGMVDGVKSAELARYQKASLSTYGNEGTGADGGFAVPQEFRDAITKLVQSEPDSLMARCDQLPISRASIAVPDDETEVWGSSGPQAYWEGEADALGQSKPALKLKEYRLRKLTALVPATEELLEDAPALGAYIEAEAPRRLRWAADEAIFRGTGVGQPLGFTNSPSFIEVAKVTSQVADTVSGQNILDMWTRLYAPYRQNAVWLCHQDVDPWLYRLSTPGTDGTGADASGFGFPLFSPPGNDRNTGPFPTLLGRPVITTQHCSTLGDAGDIVLASLDQYRCVMKTGGIESAQSMHLWFDQDAVAFKFRLRMDGAPKLSTTISPRTGSTTMSAFVGLAARA